MTLGTVISLGIICLILIIATVVFLKKDSGAFIFTGILLIAFSLAFAEVFSIYKLPHNGYAPTLSNVANKEARLDTVYTICNGDTLVDYKIKWND